jgi:hypothetical protein
VFTVGEMTNRAIASLVCLAMLIHGSLKEEEILAYADLEPAKYIYTLRTTIKMKGVIKSISYGDLIYNNYRFLNKKRETILGWLRTKTRWMKWWYFESGVGRTTYDFLTI